jgi:DNA-binding LacI/PurR family transcriptional regulator
VVTVERDLRRTDGWWVEGDSVASTHRVLDHLMGQGADRIALVTSDAPWAWFEDTSAAYAEWCEARGVRPLIRLIDVDNPRRTAAEATRKLLASRQPPNAIFALPLHAPLGVLDAAAEIGCNVPGDLLLAAGIDAQTLQVSSPPVTAVDLRPLEAARAAVSLLERRVAGEEAAGPVVVETVLVPRASTGADLSASEDGAAALA